MNLRPYLLLTRGNIYLLGRVIGGVVWDQLKVSSIQSLVSLRHPEDKEKHCLTITSR